MSGYRVGVELALVNNVSAGMGAIMSSMLGMQRLQRQITEGFATWRTALMGAVGVFTGVELGRGLMHIASHADKLIHSMKQMENQGWNTVAPWEHLRSTFAHTALPSSLLERAHELAFQISGKYQTLAYEDALGIIKEAAPIVGSRPEALGLADDLARFAVTIQGAAEGRGLNFIEETRSALKALELKGALMNPQTGALDLTLFRDYLAGMGRTITATSGFIKPSDYLQFMKQARAAGMQMNEDFFLNVAPTIMQEMGAMRAGTGMMSVFQALVGEQVTKRAAEVLQKAGVFTKPLEFGREGLTPLKFGDLLKGGEAQQNLYNWMGDRLEELELRHHGQLTRTDVIQEMAQWFGNRTAQSIADVLMTQRAKIERDRKLYQEAMDPNASIRSLYSRASADPQTAHLAMVTQWQRAMTSIGEALAPMRASVLWGLTELFNSIGNLAHSNPAMIQNIGAGLASLSAVLVGGGTAAILAAMGPAGWIAGGIAGLATALAFSGVDFTKVFGVIKGAFSGIGDAFKMVYNGEWEKIGEKIGHFLVDLPTKIIPAAVKMAIGIGEVVGEALLSIPSKLVDAAVQMADGIVRGVRESIFGKEVQAGYSVSTNQLQDWSRRHPGIYPGTQKYWETLGHDFVDRRVRAFRAHKFTEGLIERQSLLRVPATAINPVLSPGTIDLLIPADRLQPKTKTIAERFGGGEQAGPVAKTETKMINSNNTVHAPITVNMTVTQATQAPAAVGAAVGASAAQHMRGAMHDVAQ